jgi:hypothetical protein
VASWSFRDSPRFVPTAWGVVPPAAAHEHVPPELANTSGFDLANDAGDAYVFLPSSYEALRSEFLALTGPIPALPDHTLADGQASHRHLGAGYGLADLEGRDGRQGVFCEY